MKKWVVNLSKYRLDKAENSVLAKGLNFDVTPCAVPVEDFVVITEKVCSHLSPDQAQTMRSDIANVMKKARLAKPNISIEERQPLTRLKKEDSIQILPASKEGPR